jgi:hypothetical protein
VVQTAPVVVLPERVDDAEVLPRELLPAAPRPVGLARWVDYMVVVGVVEMIQPIQAATVEMDAFD